MRRVLEFLEWNASTWEKRAEVLQVGLDAGTAERMAEKLVGSRLLIHKRAEGLRAYALYQADIRRELLGDFKSKWEAVPSLAISHVEMDTYIRTVLDLDYSSLTQKLSTILSCILRR
jgi:hypothetical protein